MRPVEPTSKVGGFEKGQTQTVGNFFAETPDLAFLEASQTPGATLHIFGWEIVLFAALLFLVDLDAELGDQHSDRLRRGSYGVSLYVNLDTQRGVRAVLFLVAMMSLSIFAYRRREFKSVLRLAGIALAANVVHAVIENLSPAKADESL